MAMNKIKYLLIPFLIFSFSGCDQNPKKALSESQLIATKTSDELKKYIADLKLENNKNKELLEKKDQELELVKKNYLTAIENNKRIYHLLDDKNAVERRMLFMSNQHHWSQVYYCSLLHLTWIPYSFCSATEAEILQAQAMKNAGFPQDIGGAITAICLSVFMFLIPFMIVLRFVRNIKNGDFSFLSESFRYHYFPKFRENIDMIYRLEHSKLNEIKLKAQNYLRIEEEHEAKRDQLILEIDLLRIEVNHIDNECQNEINRLINRRDEVLKNSINMVVVAAKVSIEEAEKRAQILLKSK